MKPALHTQEFFLQCRIFTEHLASKKNQSLLLSIKLSSPNTKVLWVLSLKTLAVGPEPTRLKSSFRFHSKENGAEPHPVEDGFAVRPHRGGRPSQPPARKDWDPTAPRGPFREDSKEGELLGVREGPRSTSGPGTGVWREGCRVGRPGALPPSPTGSPGREARPDCQPPAREWTLGSERPHRPALRREVPSHRP